MLLFHRLVIFLLIRMATLQYFKKHEGAFDPIFPYPNSPGCELRSALDYDIKPGQSMQLRTDLIVKVTAGYYGKLSPLPAGFKGSGLTLLRTYISSNTATEIQIAVMNKFDVDISVKRGQVIAMLIICKVEKPTVIQRSSLSELVDSCLPAPTVEICKTVDKAFLPIEVDGGYVLRAAYFYEVEAGCREVVSTGLAFRFPEGYYGAIEATDAQTWLWKITVFGGEVLNNSKKEVKFIIGNTGSSTYKIAPGDKIGLLRLKKMYPHRTLIRSKEEMDLVGDLDDEKPKKKIMKINEGLSFKIMIVLRSEAPCSSVTDQFFQGLKNFVDDMFKNIRFDFHDSNKLYTHCRKEYNDRCISFYLNLFGDVLGALKFSEDYLINSIVSRMQDIADSLVLKCFVKVVPVKGENI